MSAFSDRLVEQAKRAGYDPVVRGSVAKLHQLLVRDGFTGVHQAVAYWLSGHRTPEPKNLRLLLDVLDVRGEARDNLVELAYPGLLVGPDAPNRLAEDDTPTEHAVREVPLDPPSAS